MPARRRRALVRPPRAADRAGWRGSGGRAEPDAAGIAAEHEALCELLASAGAEVVLGETAVDGNPDAIYAYDPALVADSGAVLLRPGKEGRLGEPDAIARDLEAAGVPVASRLDGEATAEGGDTLWLDERTLLVGRGYRTNDAGIEALRRALPDVDVLWFDLPHLHGADEVLHLMSLISPLDRDLAVAYPPLMPVRLRGLLAARGGRLLEVPDQEVPPIGPDVLPP